MGVLPVSDAAGQGQFFPLKPNPWTSKAVTCCKFERVYSEIQPEANTAKQCLENMITDLTRKSVVEIFQI